MKKIFTLIAAALLAVGAQAQKIVFTEAVEAGQVGEISNGDFKIAVTDPDSKVLIDKNSQYFGTADAYEKYDYRINTKGKSSSTKNFITATVPSAGKLVLGARSGKTGDTSRSLTVKDGEGTALLDAFVLDDANATTATINDEDKSVFPYVEVELPAEGSYVISYGGAIYFYSLEFVAGDTNAIESVKAENNAKAQEMYNLAGQQVDKNYKGVVVMNGKKFINK